MIRFFGARLFHVAYWHNRGFRGTWNRELETGLRIGPWRISLSLNVGRTREKAGAPDWSGPSVEEAA